MPPLGYNGIPSPFVLSFIQAQEADVLANLAAPPLPPRSFYAFDVHRPLSHFSFLPIVVTARAYHTSPFIIHHLFSCPLRVRLPFVPASSLLPPSLPNSSLSRLLNPQDTTFSLFTPLALRMHDPTYLPWTPIRYATLATPPRCVITSPSSNADSLSRRLPFPPPFVSSSPLASASDSYPLP
ncbi:hypothetical protein MVEN_01728000 [Mycena venus]|uniref:Uncharacterized protein n=1 Tax=Mycena venus TaxID=2733690 RepID=A0A8H6XM88_9AGAR|nr:hypothetical protein MVEN_01728000 [Mycena venus]